MTQSWSIFDLDLILKLRNDFIHVMFRLINSNLLLSFCYITQATLFIQENLNSFYLALWDGSKMSEFKTRVLMTSLSILKKP